MGATQQQMEVEVVERLRLKILRPAGDEFDDSGEWHTLFPNLIHFPVQQSIPSSDNTTITMRVPVLNANGGVVDVSLRCNQRRTQLVPRCDFACG